MAWQTIFMDGFDHYTTEAETMSKWGFGSGAYPTAARYNVAGKSLRFNLGSSDYLAKRFDASRNVIVGFAIYLNAPPTNARGASFLAIGTAPYAATSSLHLVVDYNISGNIRIFRGSLNAFLDIAGTLLGEVAVPAKRWFNIELRLYIDSTNGELEVRIDGVSQLSLTGINTQNLTSNYATSAVLMCGTEAALDQNIDDFYIRTSALTTAEPGGFLDGVRIVPKYPNADGTYSEMTPSTAGAHYPLVDEATPSTSDGVSSSTAGKRDSFLFAPVTEAGDIHAVQVNVFAAKDDAGAKSIDILAKSGATESYTQPQQLSTTAGYRTSLLTVNPSTGSAWSAAEVSAAEFGVRVSSDS